MYEVNDIEKLIDRRLSGIRSKINFYYEAAHCFKKIWFICWTDMIHLNREILSLKND